MLTRKGGMGCAVFVLVVVVLFVWLAWLVRESWLPGYLPYGRGFYGW